jgi:hypothetical protein
MKPTWKALAFLAAVAGAVLVLSTSAFAVGGGSSPPPARWRMSLGPVAWSGRLTALYPGVRGNAELFAFTVTNAGRAKQRLTRVAASVAATGGGDAQTAGGAAIRGCRANWFSVAVDRGGRPLPLQVAPGTSYRGKVGLTMRDSGTNQNACRGAAPAVTITAG